MGDEHFIQQCLDADSEREAMFFDSLEKVKRGLCVCVFDGTDRLQHMFWRDIDESHPARSNYPEANGRNVIEDLYLRMDDLVGRTISACGKDTLLMVLSDHGFNSFRHRLDLNRWLEENGYLRFHDGRREEEFLTGVDWTHTRAFALGLAGIFINIKDKYAQGIVDSGTEADQLRAEISEKLGRLIDPQNGQSAIKHAYIAGKTYRGPYKNAAPDLVIGYQRGYRVSWETAIGRTTEQVFHDNTKAWSGDHCVDPSLVPGILFCNQNIQAERMRLMDVGPTILKTFGLEVPTYMDGNAWSVGDSETEEKAAMQPELTAS